MLNLFSLDGDTWLVNLIRKFMGAGVGGRKARGRQLGIPIGSGSVIVRASWRTWKLRTETNMCDLCPLVMVS